MKRIIIIFTCFVAMVLDVAAQTIDDDKMNKRIELWTRHLDSLDRVIACKRDTIAMLSKESGKATDLVNERKRVLDSIAIDIRDINALNKQKTEILRSSVNLTDFQEFGEECLCEFIQGRLCQPYKEKYIKQAIENYRGLKSAKLRTQYAYLEPLLQGYGSYYNDFMAIIRAAQNDPIRTFVESKDEYRMRYTSRLVQMPYYKLYYVKGGGIPYLDQQIGKVLSLLEQHNPGTRSKSYTIDFSYLLYGQ